MAESSSKPSGPGRHRSWVKTGLALVAVIATTALFGELLLRAGIAAGVERLRQPSLYADPRADDDYWLLQYRWKLKDNMPKGGYVHSTLGWAPRKTADNPLGILRPGPYAPDLDGEVILFVGDSFVASPGPVAHRLPQQLDALLPEYTVYNYGVGGYGVDQILLRFQDAHPPFQRPVILFGILTMDLDRCLLRVRSGPKPYFQLEDGELRLHGVPIEPRPESFFDENRPAIRSFLTALIGRSWRLRGGGRTEVENAYRREEKEDLNRALLAAAVDEARRYDLPLIFVLFYGKVEMRYEGWREQFLRGEMERLGVPYLDTKAVLQEAADESSRRIGELYRPSGGHLNEEGNRVVAEALAELLRRELSVPPAE